MQLGFELLRRVCKANFCTATAAAAATAAGLVLFTLDSVSTHF